MKRCWLAAVLPLAIAIVAWSWLPGGEHGAPLAPPPMVSQADMAALHALVAHDLDGRRHTLDQWRGTAMVLNFWATWCGPCREEMPILSDLAERYRGRVQFVGIAADNAEKVRAFARAVPVSYPLLAGGEEVIQLSRPLGNLPLAVPFTIILDRAGRPTAAGLGRISRAALVEVLDQL